MGKAMQQETTGPAPVPVPSLGPGDSGDSVRRRSARCPACGSELHPAGSIAGRRGVLYLIARCVRCQIAFWRTPGSAGAWV